jgi:hypothetical protein
MPLDLLRETLFKSGGRDGSDPKWGHGEVNAPKAVELTLRAKKLSGAKPDWAALKELQESLASDVAALGQMIENYSRGEA